ncbi:hypothetical protein ACET3X_003961 [Alternaria dauci]|uniref:DUF7918 domain-containing protein n=1 Tax=Alternaria dauci TaxID=48095 RepID=A0ABR3ULH0_9PLEO
MVEEALGPVPSVAVLKQTLSTKGCITISFEFIESYQDSGPDIRNIRTFRSRRKILAALNEIPEKALKGDALSHQATLSKPQKCQYSPRSHRRYKSIDQGPFATFHFKYRSLASLKALGVLAITEHTPEPLENTPVEDLTPAELRETLHHVRQSKKRRIHLSSKKLEPLLESSAKGLLTTEMT